MSWESVHIRPPLISQDAMDLFLGNYNVDTAEGGLVVCPLDKNRDWKFYGVSSNSSVMTIEIEIRMLKLGFSYVSFHFC